MTEFDRGYICALREVLFFIESNKGQISLKDIQERLENSISVIKDKGE